MRTYQIARRALENLFNEVNTVALGRRTDRGFQAINGEITGWCPRLCYRKISPLGSVIPATTAFIWVSSGDRMVRDAHAGFEFDLNPSTNAPMQDLAWDPWTWEVFCGQFTGGTIYPPRQTAVLTRCAPPDDANRCNEISVMKLLDAGHGHMIGFQRRKSELWLWQNWTRWMPGGGRRFYLVRFRWRSRVAPYTWEDPPLDMQVMPTFHDDQTVVYAQLDPLGKYIAYRVGGGGYDRFELRTLGDVERGIDRVLDRAGPFPTTKDTAQAAGWADRYTVQGFATVGGRLWRYTGDGTGTNRSDPAALTEYDWNSGGEVARHNEPKDIGYLGPGTRWEPEGLTIVRTAPDQIRVLWGVARGPTGNREFLIYSFAYPLKTS